MTIVEPRKKRTTITDSNFLKYSKKAKKLTTSSFINSDDTELETITRGDSWNGSMRNNDLEKCFPNDVSGFSFDSNSLTTMISTRDSFDLKNYRNRNDAPLSIWMNDNERVIEEGTQNIRDTTLRDEEAVQDLRTFQHTEELFRSNVFRLQMDELLKEIRVSYLKLNGLEGALKRIHSIIDQIEPVFDLTWAQAVEYIKEALDHKTFSYLGASWLATSGETATDESISYRFSFNKPARIHLVGSFPLRTCAKPILNVDVAVEMPNTLFHPKDYLDHRYFRKRAFYLAKLAVALRETNAFGHLSYQWFHGDHRKPILLVHSLHSIDKEGRSIPTHTELVFDKTHFVIRLIPFINRDTFKLSKLSPMRKNLRKSILDGVSTSSSTSWPTPFYNSSLLSEMFYREHLMCVHEALLKCPSAIDAILLLKTWLRLRGFNAACGAFDGFLITMLVACLLRQRTIGKSFSSYQIFRAVLNFIVNHEWSKIPLSFDKAIDPHVLKPHQQTELQVPIRNAAPYQTLFPVVFMDPGETSNLAARVSETAIQEMQYEANISLRMLNDGHVDCFTELFLRPSHRFLRFDISCRLRLPRHMDLAKIGQHTLLTRLTSCSQLSSEVILKQLHDLIDMGSFRLYFLYWLPSILRQALKDRVHCVRLEATDSENLRTESGNFGIESSFNLVEGNNDSTDDVTMYEEVFLGLRLNSEHAFRQIDHGPQVEDNLATKAFRELWGDRAELRRFKDGTIREVVSWQDSLQTSKLAFYIDLLEFLLRRHMLRIPQRHVWWLSPSFYTTSSEPSNSSIGDEKMLSLGEINRAFFDFSKQLRQLNELPLMITSVQAARYYTYTETVSSRNKGTLCFFQHQPFEVTLHFESTSQWPNHLEAIRTLKTAFYLRLAEQLKPIHGISYVMATRDFLDVVSRDRLAFRVRIVHEREFRLLRDNQPTQFKSGRMHRLEKDLMWRPRLVSRLQTLAAQFPVFHDVLKLARQWFDSHFFSSYIPIEVVDLLVAFTFVNSTQLGGEPAVSDTVGFYRFIHLLASYDWYRSPLLVDYDRTLSLEDIHRIRDRFTELRRPSTSQHALIFIATPDDMESHHWTWDMPNKIFLSRLICYAKQSLEVLQNRMNRWGSSVSPLVLCSTPLDGYDVILYINFESIDGFTIENDEMAISQAVGFDPITRFVRELRRLFGEYALFLYNPNKITMVAIVWKPVTRLVQPLKFRTSFMSLPTIKTTSGVHVHCEGILHAIKVLGGDLIRKVAISQVTDDNRVDFISS